MISKFAFCVIILGLITLFQFSCTSKFDKAGWNNKEGWDYPNRRVMLNDLLKNHQIKGLRYQQLVDSIGELDLDTATNKGYYNIITDYGWDIDPVYSKDLVIQFDKNSIVTGFKIVEWKKD